MANSDCEKERTMKTQRELYPKTELICTCELESCPKCKGRMKIAYVSGPKLVQTLSGTISVVHQAKGCRDEECGGNRVRWQSAQWRQIAPRSCTYGFDVIARIGWLRQSGKEQFGAIQNALQKEVQICETEVRMLYHERYLPLLACNERRFEDQLHAIAMQKGLIFTLDGLASPVLRAILATGNQWHCA